METFIKFFSVFLMWILFCVIIALIMGLPVMLLWNWLMPAIFGITKVTFWQSIGINFLCAILFGSKLNYK